MKTTKMSFHDAVLEQLIEKPNKSGTRQMFNVENNESGKLFVKMLRKALNKETYTITVRGSRADRVDFTKRTGIRLGADSVPLKHADRLRVYVQGSFPIETDGCINYREQVAALKDENDKCREVISRLSSEIDNLTIEHVLKLEDNFEMALCIYDSDDWDLLRSMLNFHDVPPLRKPEPVSERYVLLGKWGTGEVTYAFSNDAELGSHPDTYDMESIGLKKFYDIIAK